MDIMAMEDTEDKEDIMDIEDAEVLTRMSIKGMNVREGHMDMDGHHMVHPNQIVNLFPRNLANLFLGKVASL